jgi:hypothetical protein
MHQREATTSLLDWHPDEPSSHAAKLKNIILEKGEKLCTRGGD